jgi:hypothetical protein
MKNIIKAAVLLAGLAMGANAQLKGLGYDNGWKEVSARLGLGPNALDVGLGFSVSPKKDSTGAKFRMSASGLFLGHLHDWGPVDTYFAAGGRFEKTAAPSRNVKISAVGGFQPEVTLLDHIVVSTRFGLEIPLLPDFVMKTVGSDISIVSGFNFKILF